VDGKIKAPPPAGRMWLVGLEIFGVWPTRPAGASRKFSNDINHPSASRTLPKLEQPRRRGEPPASGAMAIGLVTAGSR